PTSRGTYGILSTRMIIMVICVWAVMHLNLPRHNEESKQLWRKIGWLFLGLFAPELVA
ncbi:hypothetical protein K432DRAFT_286468, partial [Lepidopterella palustris CBS 459.81]